VPEGSRDLEVERATLLDHGFDELNGIDWDKGCYIGQELTARMKYRALVKKRLVPVTIDGPSPAPGTPVTRDGADAGTLRSVAGDVGLALLRLEHIVDAAPGALRAGEARLSVRIPAWLDLERAHKERTAPSGPAGSTGQSGETRERRDAGR